MEMEIIEMAMQKRGSTHNNVDGGASPSLPVRLRPKPKQLQVAYYMSHVISVAILKRDPGCVGCKRSERSWYAFRPPVDDDDE